MAEGKGKLNKMPIIKRKLIRKAINRFARNNTPFFNIGKFSKKIVVKFNKKYNSDMDKYIELCERESFYINKNYNLPFVTDWDGSAGNLGAYFYQDLWAAKKIHENNPENHYDIGSRVDGFIMALLSFRKVTLLDIRPLRLSIDGLSFLQTDATTLHELEDNSVASLSSLCALEHFGLGRYGDPIDPDACFKAFDAVQRVMATGGKVYISVPVSYNERVEFNAHRIFSPDTIFNEFKKMRLVEFKVANSRGYIDSPLEDKAWDSRMSSSNYGLFEFEKI